MSKKIALFIDADNISPKFGKHIIETLESRGEIFIRRIYGNWKKISLHGWNDCILNFSLRAVQQPDYVAGKNATDMSLAIDAMDVLYGGKAEIFVLVSNDSDFTPLAIRLREGGTKIIGMGNAQAANSFRLSCDEFIDLDAPAEVEIQVAPKKKISPPEKISPVQMNLFTEEKLSPKPVSPKVIHIGGSKIQSERDKKIRQIHNILREVANIHDDANGFFLLTRAGTEIKSRNLGFSVKDLGYSSLREFVAAFPKLYELSGSGASILMRCLTTAQKNPVAKTKSEQLNDILHEVALTHEDSEGFVNLWWVCDFIISKKNLPADLKKFSHKDLVEFVSATPELYETRQGNGNDFFYRCRTFKQQIANAEEKLRQLHDIILEAANIYGEADGFFMLNLAGTEIKSRNLDFNVKDLGYATLKEFIAAFPDLYELQTAGTIARCRCKTIAPEVDNLQQIHNVLRETAKAHGDEKGFATLSWAGDAIGKKNLSIKGLGHKTLSKFISAFPNLYEVKGTGTNISYRCK